MRNRTTVIMPKLKPRPLINVGATIDIPTSALSVGAKGETILNGGLSSVVGVIGRGNNFKTTILNYMILTAADRTESSLPEYTHILTYDTENNMEINLSHFNSSANHIINYLPKDPIYNKVWDVISKASMSANVWVKDILYKLVSTKEEDKSAVVSYDCFMDPMTNKPLELMYPTFITIDSLSEFEPESTVDALETKEADKTNTLFMQQGLFKTKVLKDLPRLSNKGNIFFGLTAHLGNKIDMSSNPYAKPTKTLQYLKQDENIKGVTDKINFLTTHLWKAFGSTALLNTSTKTPLYPLYKNDSKNDLNIVKLQQFRSKTGTSGFILDLIISQTEGVQPELTELHYCKANKFGIGGNPRNYFMDLLPDVPLTNNTVRGKLKDNLMLRRAVTITAELHQLSVYKPYLKGLLCSAKVLRKDLEELGYDWDMLLRTRGWWAIKQYSTDIPPFLSVIDLLKMREGSYKPYWLKDDKKTLVGKYKLEDMPIINKEDKKEDDAEE